MKLTKSLRTAALAVLAMVLLAPAAQAGGLQSASSAASSFSTWLYSFLAICAVVYMGWKGAEAMTDKGHWSDFGWACGKVAVVGSVTVLTPWLWSIFTS